MIRTRILARNLLVPLIFIIFLIAHLVALSVNRWASFSDHIYVLDMLTNELIAGKTAGMVGHSGC